MGSIAKKMFISRLETEGIKFIENENNENDVIIGMGQLIIHFVFREEKAVNIIGTNLLKYRKEKEEEVLRYCNELNLTYRFFKFCMESRADQVCICYDAVVQPDICAGVCFDMLQLMTKTAFDEEEEFKKRELM